MIFCKRHIVINIELGGELEFKDDRLILKMTNM